jgi:tetratricopeptide (TPR) repeat protein
LAAGLILATACFAGGSALAPIPSFAQGPTVETFAQGLTVEKKVEIEKLFRAGNIEAALKEARKVERETRAASGVNSQHYISTLGSLADLEIFHGAYFEAERLIQQSLAIQERIYGPRSTKLSYVLWTLGVAYETQGRLTEAEGIYRRVLAIREASPSKPDKVFARVLLSLANIALREDRDAEAETLYRRALAIQDEVLGKDSGESTTTMDNLALALRAQEKYAEAQLWYERSLSIAVAQGGKRSMLELRTHLWAWEFCIGFN